MGEACLRVFYARNAGDKAAVHFVLGIAHFLPVKPFVAAAHTAPTKATLIRLADTATWACYRKNSNCSATSPPQRLALMTIEDAN